MYSYILMLFETLVLSKPGRCHLGRHTMHVPSERPREDRQLPQFLDQLTICHIKYEKSLEKKNERGYVTEKWVTLD